MKIFKVRKIWLWLAIFAILFVPFRVAFAQDGIPEPFVPYAQILTGLTFLGWTLTGLIVFLIERLKQWVALVASYPKEFAIGLGTVFGSLILIFLAPVLDLLEPSVAFMDYLYRVLGAFFWAWTAPWSFELLTATAKKGAKHYIQDVEENAQLGKPQG